MWGYPTSTSLLQVDWLSMDPRVLERHTKKIIAKEYLMRSEVQSLYFRLYSSITKFLNSLNCIYIFNYLHNIFIIF